VLQRFCGAVLGGCVRADVEEEGNPNYFMAIPQSVLEVERGSTTLKKSVKKKYEWALRQKERGKKCVVVVRRNRREGEVYR
jgi:hypothetical protein